MPIYEISIDGKPRKVEITRKGGNSFAVKIDDKTLIIEVPDDNFDLEKEFSIIIVGKEYRIELPKIDRESIFPVRVDEATFKAEVQTPTRRPALAIFEPASVATARRTIEPKQAVEGAVNAPMTGVILSVLVKKGDQVKTGQVMCILEAMKMENEIKAPKAGTVKEVYVSEGSSVSEGEVLLVIK